MTIELFLHEDRASRPQISFSSDLSPALPSSWRKLFQKNNQPSAAHPTAVRVKKDRINCVDIKYGSAELNINMKFCFSLKVYLIVHLRLFCWLLIFNNAVMCNFRLFSWYFFFILLSTCHFGDGSINNLSRKENIYSYILLFIVHVI